MESEAMKWAVMGILGIIMGLADWALKQNITQTKEDIKELRTDISNRLHKDDFRDFKAELRGMFDELKNDIRAINREKS